LDAKNNTSRVIFITEPTRQVLENLPPASPDELLFKARSEAPIQGLSATCSRVVKALGLNNGIIDRREKLCFHSLRHTHASWAVMAGVPLYKVRKLTLAEPIDITTRLG
jgi:integrase